MDSEINKNKTLERINYILKDSKDIEQIRRIILKSLDGKISLDSLHFYLQNGSNLNPKQINAIINLSTPLIKKYSYDNIINDEKTVSVIIPAYNKKEFLVKTIESILMQSYKNIEIIIIDDASTDGTESLIKEKYSNNKYIRYYKNPKNIDVGKCRLKGYNLCKGDYVIFIDHDDFYTDSNFF